MRNITRLLALCCSLGAASFGGWGQTEGHSVPNLVTQTVDESQPVVLRGNTHALARAQFNSGAAAPELALNRLMLVLKRSPQQEEDLARLLRDQQDASSSSYHRWLTPAEFGERFGLSAQDIRAITDWLELHGFQVNEIAPGRIYIEFSGNVAQVQAAFRTSIHRYQVNGVDHLANSNDPAIPAALASVIVGISTLHNFFAKPQLILSKTERHALLQSGAQPSFGGGSGNHALAPADYAVIYNIKPLYLASINGRGTTVAVVGRSDINLQDVASFRSIFGLPANNPQIVLNGADPGNLGGGEEAEAVLDTSWSGAIAPGATVKFVVSASTSTTDGVDLSEAYVVNHNLADVMTESFGSCEANYTAAQAASVASLAQQAAAEGITYLVSSGDNGSDGCDDPSATYQATQPASVNMLSSPPYVTAVGGTQFDDGNGGGPFWNSTTGNALSYIPEDVWNENCDESYCSNSFSLWAGSGGASVFFAKPSWQAGVAGIPNDTVRHVPDVSLTAAVHDPYLLCLGGGCTPDASGNISLSAIGGTSAAAPSFAGIMALVVQKTGSRQGLANPVLYKLAGKETLSQCDGSNTSVLPAGTCIFNDVTIGTNAVPGEPDFGTDQETYNAGMGYDMATGLGSVNAANLVNGWNSAVGAPMVTLSKGSLALGSVTVGQSTSQTISLTNSGSATLSLTGISISGSNANYFSQANTCGTALGAGSTCSISITFQPKTPGVASALLVLNDNAAASPQSIGLSGTGVVLVCTFSLSSASGSYTAAASAGTVSLSVQPGCGWNASSGSPAWLTITSGAAGTGSGIVAFSVASNTGVARTGTLTIAGQTFTASQAAAGTTPVGLRFVPITPCRIADTRNANGPFGGPAIAADSVRQFSIPSSACGISATAQAYSLNVTVVPGNALGHLTIWPTGQALPDVSTLNSDGRVKANAAIVAAGTGGAISVYASDQTHLILDINGYFVPSTSIAALEFFPVKPCRIADTRSGTGPLGGPYLPGGETRDFPILTSTCGLPTGAKAYSLNITAVPKQPIGHLTAWPAGQPQPTASTLNAPTGAVVANAAIVPGGTGGDVSVFSTADTDLILDVNGYFAAPATGGLAFYTLSPCRTLDSRNPSGSAPFSGTLAVNITGSGCAAPITASVYALNATVVPSGSLGLLSLWAQGQTQPIASTLNASDGAITSNMALVPAGKGIVDAYASNPTYLILDVTGYFAP